MLSFVLASMEERQIENHKNYMFTQANIMSNQLIKEFQNLSLPYTNEYYTDTVVGFSREINARVMILDEQGKVLIDSYNEYKKDAGLRNYELNVALSGKPSSNVYEFDTSGRVNYTAVPVEDRGQVIGAILLTSSLEPIYEELENLLRSILILAVISVGFSGATSFVFAEILSSPIEELTESVNRVAFGHHDEKIRLEGNDEIKVLENSFTSMMVKLDQVDMQRKQFVSNVSHELRTPLTAVKILSSSLLADESINPEIYREFLTDIDMEVDRLNEIINSLLYLVDLEKKELELNYTNSTLNALISKVIRQLQPLANQKNITIEFKANEKVWASFDQSKIHQCLSNLISNAIKYNIEGGHVWVKLIQKRSKFIIQIIDDGLGVSSTDLPHLFDRFYRADKARNRQTGGTGLGLSIVQQIVQLHQGEIRVSSTLNQGTTFEIELPKGV